MEKFEWDPHDIYMSNHGNGPLRARILCVCRGVVTMERWNVHKPQSRTQFNLSIKYLKHSGWLLVAAEPPSPGASDA